MLEQENKTTKPKLQSQIIKQNVEKMMKNFYIGF